MLAWSFNKLIDTFEAPMLLLLQSNLFDRFIKWNYVLTSFFLQITDFHFIIVVIILFIVKPLILVQGNLL
jgi:hypothetical protein